jgi:hypothetical protein
VGAPVEGLAARRQIFAGAERPASAGDDDDSHLVIGIGFVE